MASVVIADNASGSPQTVSLSGAAVGTLGVSLSATSLNFGEAALGSSSVTQTLTLTNTGSLSLTLGQVGATAGNYLDFSETRDNCFNATLAPGSSCGVTLAFLPQAVGVRTATYFFNDSAPSSPQAVSLSGTGVQPTTPTGTYSVGVLTTSGGIAHQIALPLTVQ